VTLHSASETFGVSLRVESLRSRLAKIEAGLCLNYKPDMIRETLTLLLLHAIDLYDTIFFIFVNNGFYSGYLLCLTKSVAFIEIILCSLANFTVT
jgi:hypothetical protein